VGALGVMVVVLLMQVQIPESVFTNLSVLERLLLFIAIAFALGRTASRLGSAFVSMLAYFVGTYKSEEGDSVAGTNVSPEIETDPILLAFKYKRPLNDDGSIVGPEIWSFISVNPLIENRIEMYANSQSFWDSLLGAQIMLLVLYILGEIPLGMKWIFCGVAILGLTVAASISARVTHQKFWHDCAVMMKRGVAAKLPL
jgi:hypothetical protein